MDLSEYRYLVTTDWLAANLDSSSSSSSSFFLFILFFK